MAAADPRTEILDLLGGKLHDAPAPATHHVVVRSFAEGVFVMGLLNLKTNLLQDAAVHQKRQGSVNRGLADFLVFFAQMIQDLLRFEVFMEVEDSRQDLLPCTGVLDPMILEIPAEDIP